MLVTPFLFTNYSYQTKTYELIYFYTYIVSSPGCSKLLSSLAAASRSSRRIQADPGLRGGLLFLRGGGLLFLRLLEGDLLLRGGGLLLLHHHHLLLKLLKLLLRGGGLLLHLRHLLLQLLQLLLRGGGLLLLHGGGLLRRLLREGGLLQCGDDLLLRLLREGGLLHRLGLGCFVASSLPRLTSGFAFAVGVVLAVRVGIAI